MKNVYPVSSLLEVVTEHEEHNDRYGEDYNDPAFGTMNVIDYEILMWVISSMEDKAMLARFFDDDQSVTAWCNLERYLNL